VRWVLARILKSRWMARATAMGHRLEMQRMRYDMREWVMKRRERTRHLIELGGLVQKCGLVELTNDDLAVLYGAFLELTDILKGETREQTLAGARQPRIQKRKKLHQLPPANETLLRSVETFATIP